jgi:hypothetical protein
MANPIKFDSAFVKADIGSIQHLSPSQPVWAVHGIRGGTVVVKSDEVVYGNIHSVTNSNALMGIVSPVAKAKPLEVKERAALSQWVEMLSSGMQDLEPQEQQGLLFLKQCLGPMKRAWYKMEYLHQISTLATEKAGQGKKVAAALNAPGGLEQLGKIVAVDMFNSNNDRFGFERGVETVPQGREWGEAKQNLNYLANIGNIVIREVGEGYQIVGLDAFDPASRLSGLQVPEIRTWKWAYDIFDPNYPVPGMIDIVAKRCVQDLNDVIGMRKSGFIHSYRLGKSAPARFAAGLREGAKLIEESFKNKYGNSIIPIPPGILIRAKRAGWTWAESGVRYTSRVRN